ncbi:hypothetical protein H5410_057151 [Solanum commersonii]|uniref:Uncharacterized protein n=1 Tax=Solanum commersonii TaxID=4109 RepID=A0A9J5WM77_SOLCO|nr:hypothetical protein H5410_057151 [Solanum commersonii]
MGLLLQFSLYSSRHLQRQLESIFTAERFLCLVLPSSVNRYKQKLTLFFFKDYTCPSSKLKYLIIGTEGSAVETNFVVQNPLVGRYIDP